MRVEQFDEIRADQRRDTLREVVTWMEDYQSKHGICPDAATLRTHFNIKSQMSERHDNARTS